MKRLEGSLPLSRYQVGTAMESWIAAVKAPSNHTRKEAIAPAHMINGPS